MPVTLNVLKNDADPDNDPLTVAGLPQLVAIDRQRRTRSRRSRCSDDGEFFFLPTVAGDYVFLYAIIDGSERDAAYIRIRVDEATENRPPTAIRDDVTISRGDTRNVYVLENDTDPDGDVIGIVDWIGRRGHRGRAGARLRASGSRCCPTHRPARSSRTRSPTAAATLRPAPSSSRSATTTRPTSRRSPGPTPSRCAPAARPRRAVLVNDYDPEGGTLRVVGVSDVPGAELRIGPGGQEIYVSVDAATVSSFTFGYDVADEAGNQTGSLVQVRLVPIGDVNRPPVARPDVARTVSGRPIDIPVLANDSDPDGDAIQIETIAAQPTFGTATVNTDGTIRYSPTARRERLRPPALHARRRQRRSRRRRGRDRRAAGRRREPRPDRHQRHLHRHRRQRHPTVRRARQRLRSRRRPAVDRRRRRRLRRRRHRPVGRGQLRAAAHARRRGDTRPCRSPTRSPTVAAAPTGRSSRSRSSSRASRSPRSRSTTSPGRSRRGQGLDDQRARQRLRSRRPGRRSDRRQRLDPLLPIAADGTLTITDRRGHHPPRLHDHRPRRARRRPRR